MALQRALRHLFSGVVILPALVLLVSNPIAAQWTAVTEPFARSEFRPPARADHKDPSQMRRLRPAVPRAANAVERRARLPDITDGRSGARKAVPVQRGQELGLRFRPDDRETLYGEYPQAGIVGGTTEGSQQPFRPIAPRRKPTYEELEAQRQGEAAAPPPSPGYPILQPPMMPPATGPWPRW